MAYNHSILVVDDEPDILKMYCSAFVKAGYQVTSASSAEEALELNRKTPFKVTFLDLNLPGMSGVELCRIIRNEYPMTICYAVTGYASLIELCDCRSAGFEDYFIKPASIVDLLEAANIAFRKIERWRKR